MNIKTLLLDFIHLIYPNTCLVCGEILVQGEEHICIKCLYKLPKTNYHLQEENQTEKKFWGKVKIEHATAFYSFQKGSSVQKLLHELKYKGKKEIGEVLGKHMAIDLMQCDKYEDIDLIVPVPLHKNRYNKRGYNQSEWIAKGLSAIMEKPIETESLVRLIENTTQTKKAVYERWENTQGIFEVSNSSAFENKHILLVDDVLTTGATLEACVEALLKTSGIKVSIVTLAVA